MATKKPMEDTTTTTAEAGAQGSTGQTLQGSEPSGRGQGEVQVGSGSTGGAVQQPRQSGLAAFGRDPLFATMQRLSDEMDQLFDSFVYGRPLARRSRQSQGQLENLWAPDVEICEEGNQLRICVDLPGVSKENINVDVQDGMLTIHGERREERSEGGEQQGYRRSERRYGSFYRAIALPEGVKGEEAQARMKDGVLEVTLPLPEQKQPRRLEIQ